MRSTLRFVALSLTLSACSSDPGDTSEQLDQSTNEDDDATSSDDDSSADDDATSSDDDSSADDDAVTADDDVPGPMTLPAPMNHRPTAEACDNERPPGGLSYPYPNDTCEVDEDCTDGINGRCQDLRGATCTYDQCFEDSECTGGGPCGCEMGFWTDANACLGGNCQIDADCGEGGYCSPSFGSCGGYSGVVAYWCRTPLDTCVEDSECVDPELGAGYCALYPEVGYWACQYGQCVG